MTRRVIYEKLINGKNAIRELIKLPVYGKVELLRMGWLPERGIL